MRFAAPAPNGPVVRQMLRGRSFLSRFRSVMLAAPGMFGRQTIGRRRYLEETLNTPVNAPAQASVYCGEMANGSASQGLRRKYEVFACSARCPGSLADGPGARPPPPTVSRLHGATRGSALHHPAHLELYPGRASHRLLYYRSHRPSELVGH